MAAPRGAGEAREPEQQLLAAPAPEGLGGGVGSGRPERRSRSTASHGSSKSFNRNLGNGLEDAINLAPLN